ncbi:MAG: thiolase family protein [Steroidobacteraceae bacterium]
MSFEPIAVLAARRTPVGAFQGCFASVTATELGGHAIKGALDASGLEATDVGEVIMGCVLPAGLGQGPARQASLAAGIPESTPCVTLNKLCGSGMKAVMAACDSLRNGDIETAVAGGLESMTNAPYMLLKARSGYRLGHGEQLLDHMFRDGLLSPWDGKPMGCFADATAARYGFTREEQDAYAAESVRRAMAAIEGGAFVAEITPVEVAGRKGSTLIDRDETPFTCDISKIPTMRPAFSKDGTVTAASSSSISDGAAALVLATETAAASRGLKPVARILGYSTHAQAPEWFTTAPVTAIDKLMKKLGWQVSDVDLFEINEAFATVTMAAIRDCGLDPAKVNVNGGACALGHPVGATGARITTTLIHALATRGLKRGIASLCIGGGEATALAIELA